MTTYCTNTLQSASQLRCAYLQPSTDNADVTRFDNRIAYTRRCPRLAMLERA